MPAPKSSHESSTERPLSPHLQIYRWRITMVCSILHRATGIGLAFGIILIMVWVVLAVFSRELFELYQTFWNFWIARFALFFWAWALIYHALNGIRHFAWDLLKGLEIKTARFTGWLVLGLSFTIALARFGPTLWA